MDELYQCLLWQWRLATLWKLVHWDHNQKIIIIIAYSYYGTLMCRIEWYHFRWPWVTSNPGFKVTTVFEVKTVRFRDKVTIELGNHTQFIKWHHIQWPWVTSETDFKVMTSFHIEYLRNDTRQSHSYYRTSIGSRMRSIAWWHFQWHWWTGNPVVKGTAFLKSNILRTKFL